MNEVVREGVDNVIGKVRKTSASNDYLNALAIFFVSLCLNLGSCEINFQEESGSNEIRYH